MTKEEMAKAYAEGFIEEYREIAYDAFLCGYGAKCSTEIPNDLEEAARHSEILTYPMPEDGDIKKVFEVQEARVFHEIGFIAGAKWQAKRMKDEKEKE